MAPARLEFWFDFASTYSYLSAMRITEAAETRGADITWRPFLLGPIFAAQGWDTSPFNLYPAKGAHMWRDMERLATERGLALTRPDPFPQNSLMAARVALAVLDRPGGPAFCRAVFHAEFASGKSISDPATLAACLTEAGLPPDLTDTAGDPAIKGRLRAQTDRAMSLGIFGAPSFTVGDELYWGDDRLDAALALASV